MEPVGLNGEPGPCPLDWFFSCLGSLALFLLLETLQAFNLVIFAKKHFSASFDLPLHYYDKVKCINLLGSQRAP